MQAWHQKTIHDSDTWLNVFIAEETEFPPHWHEAVEVVYVLDGSLGIGVNNRVYTLEARDILLISGGDVHYFIPQPQKVKRIILHFEMAFIEPFAQAVKNRRFTRLLLKETGQAEGIHPILEKHILEILREDKERKEGYKLVLKARLFDILVVLLREVPMEEFSPNERNRNLNRLERLEQVLKFVEENHEGSITLAQAAREANFSIYHFTRFFRSATGMTFWQYLNNFRVSKAAEYLGRTEESITEIAFKTGFGSIKTFNRVFKESKGCSPSEYRKAIYG